jgi:hypothetical protein
MPKYMTEKVVPVNSPVPLVTWRANKSPMPATLTEPLTEPTSVVMVNPEQALAPILTVPTLALPV